MLAGREMMRPQPQEQGSMTRLATLAAAVTIPVHEREQKRFLKRSVSDSRFQGSLKHPGRWQRIWMQPHAERANISGVPKSSTYFGLRFGCLTHLAHFDGSGSSHWTQKRTLRGRGIFLYFKSILFFWLVRTLLQRVGERHHWRMWPRKRERRRPCDAVKSRAVPDAVLCLGP